MDITQIAERTRTYSWENPFISAQAAMQMDGLEFLQALIRGEYPAPPIAHTLDFRLLEVESGRAVFGMTPSEFHYNPIGVVHGGMACMILDSALGCAVQSQLPKGMAYTTVQINVNLVRALTKDTGFIRCEARIIHSGRQTATAEAEIKDASGKIYAHATTTCLIFPIPENGK